MEVWNNFEIKHTGINEISYTEYPSSFLQLGTFLVDKKTGYTVVHIYTALEGKLLEFHIGTNEKMVKRLKLPYYKHKAEYSYIKGKKYFDQKTKKDRMITCLSLGPGNVQKVFKNILLYWQESGYTIKKVYVTRETGITRRKSRTYEIRGRYEY